MGVAAISANISAVSAAVISAVPGQSAWPPAGSRDSRSRATPAAKAATPMGRLMKKMDRQPSVSVSTPPASGPIAVAPPIAAPKTPSTSVHHCRDDIPDFSAIRVTTPSHCHEVCQMTLRTAPRRRPDRDG